MASISDMNIVIGQGNAIKEVQNVKRQTLELNQQYVSRQAEEKQKKSEKEIQESDETKKVDEQKEESDGKKRDDEDEQDRKRKIKKDGRKPLKSGLIDIKV